MMRPLQRQIRILTIKLFGFILSSLRIVVDNLTADCPSKLAPITSPLLLMSATKLAAAIKSGEVTAEAVVSAYVNRIKAVNPIINAIVDTRHDDAIRDAREIDRQLALELTGHQEAYFLKKPLLGVPITLKNSIPVKGMIQDGGLARVAGRRSARDGHVVQKLREAGCVILGITNVPEALAWFETKNYTYGVTNNPYDLSRTAAGSSGGEGAALGSACSVIGVGSDMLGSCRMPAHCCGIFGHKPTNGTIKCLDGLVPNYPESLSPIFTFGPMTRYASDLRPLLKEMVEPDQLELLQLDKDVDISKLKLFYMDDTLRDPGASPVSQEVKDSMQRGIKHLEANYGLQATKVSFAKMSRVIAYWSVMVKELDGKFMTSYLWGDSVAGHRSIVIELIKSWFGLSRHYSHVMTLAGLEVMTEHRGSVAQRLSRLRGELKADLHKLLGSDGILVAPTLPTVAPKHGKAIFTGSDPGYSGIFNVLECPATHVTMGLTAKGLPIGFEVVSGPYNDRYTLAVAEVLERAFGGWVSPSDTVFTFDCNSNQADDKRKIC